MTRRSHRTVTAFEQYVSGRRALGDGAVFFLETATHLADVLREAERNDVVFTPSRSTSFAQENVMECGGRFREPGDRLVLDAHHVVELQEYVAAPFLSIVSPTVIRQGSAEGLAAFLSDADTARDDGIFVGQLLSPMATLESRASFLASAACGGGLVRVHVTADGEYRDGPDGALLGQVGDARAEVRVAADGVGGRGRPFARIMDPRVLDADLDDRPWFGRYLAALDALRDWRGSRGRPTISGFGGHLIRALDESAAFPVVVSADAPLLMTDDGEEYVLVDPHRRIHLRLGIDAARATECLLATGDESSATGLLAFELGVRPTGIAPLMHRLGDQLRDAGIDLGASRRAAS